MKAISRDPQAAIGAAVSSVVLTKGVGIFSFLNRHQPELRGRANRKDGTAVGKNSHGGEVGNLWKSCEPFRPASVRRKPDNVNGPVHHIGVESISQTSFQEPHSAGDGE